MVESVSLLIVDDSDSDIGIIERYLGAVEYPQLRTESCKSRLALAAKLLDCHYDIVMIDKYLGPDKGLEAIAEYSTQYPNTHFILMSGDLGSDVEAEAIDMGARSCCLKWKLSAAYLEQLIVQTLKI